MTATITPQAFVAKWQQSTLRERASSQEHFIDLCRLIGHATPAEADPHGTWFTFEKGASKATGGEGWADVWKRDCFAWEYKGKHANLDKAYGQLLLYSGALANPPLLIVSDMATIRIHTHFTNTVRVTTTLTLDDLLLPEKLELLRQAFDDPEKLRSPVTTTQVTQQAAEKFAAIAQILRRSGNHPSEVAHFLIRLLFCLFAEDVGILPDRLFSRLVTRPRQNAAAFAGQLRQLFAAMATGGYFGVETIPHVDGGLFDDDALTDRGLPALDDQSLAVLAEVSRLDWAAIEPAIFGTLFQRGLDPGERAQLGAHFTSEEDILLVVEPVLMAPLRRRWEEVRAEALAGAGKRDAAKGKARARLEAELFGLLRGFRGGAGRGPGVGRGLWERQLPLRQPAAAVGPGERGHQPGRGAGRHPVVSRGFAEAASRHRDQPLRVRAGADDDLDRVHPVAAGQRLRAAGRADPEAAGSDPADGRDPEVRRGRAAGRAGVAGGGCDRRESAVLGRQEDARGVGRRSMWTTCSGLYDGRVPGGADLVTYWFEKARAQIAAGKAKRAGLLATQLDPRRCQSQGIGADQGDRRYLLGLE